MGLNIERIISEVKKRPELYDLKNENYRNIELKLESWLQVAENVTGKHFRTLDREDQIEVGKVVQKKWKSLRDAYHRSVRLQLQSNVYGTQLKKPYVYSHLMTFLRPKFMSRIIINNSHLEDVDDKPIKTEDVYTTYENEEDEVITINDDGNSELSDETYVQRAKRKKKSDSFKTELMDDLQQNTDCDESDGDSSSDVVSIQDADTLFFLSLVPKVKKLKESASFDFQIKCMQLLQTYLENPDNFENAASADSISSQSLEN